MSVSYHGRSYVGTAVQVAPRHEGRVGFVVLPGCNDTGRNHKSPDEKLPVARLPGVSPNVALVWPGHNDVILVRRGKDQLPSEVTALLHAPGCRKGDAPIRLSGPWLGILGADGNTEVDLVPPYNIDLLARDSSTHRYKNAFLKVRVPASLGRPLTKKDVRQALWSPGTILVEVRCSGSRFIAEHVTTQSGH